VGGQKFDVHQGPSQQKDHGPHTFTTRALSRAGGLDLDLHRVRSPLASAAIFPAAAEGMVAVPTNLHFLRRDDRLELDRNDAYWGKTVVKVTMRSFKRRHARLAACWPNDVNTVAVCLAKDPAQTHRSASFLFGTTVRR
jgi:hypothetical protein